MKLDLIVPRYKEPWSVCKYLFDSVAMQRGIDLSEINVIVVNDGDEDVLDRSVFDDYPYAVEYHVVPHGGVSAARNHGIDLSRADYIMFCDIDDGFINNYGLRLVFNEMKDNFDFCFSNFVEEVKTPDGSMQLVSHNDDMTFVHGKVYRREFLIEKNVRFDEAMRVHEDGYFNSLAYVESKGRQNAIKTPFYLWMWHDNSTVRKGREDFVLKTYKEVLQARTGICNEFKRRGHEEEYKIAVCNTVLNSYYDFQKNSYWLDKNAKYRKKAERAFREYYITFGDTFSDCTYQMISTVAKAARANACQNGMLLERETLKQFLARIMKK